MKNRKTSIRNQLFTLICAVAFLPLFIYIWQLYKLKNGFQDNIEKSFNEMKEINSSIIETDIYKLFSSISTDISDRISTFFNFKEEQLISIARMESFPAFDRDTKEKILYTQLTNYRDIMRLTFRYNDKKIFSYSKSGWLSTFNFNDIIKDDDLFEGMQNGDIYRFVSDPYPALQPPKMLLITMSIPVFDISGKIESAIYAEISLFDIGTLVKEISLQMSGYSFGHRLDFFVVDSLGRLVFYPDHEQEALSQTNMSHLYIVQHLLSKKLHGTVTYYENNNPMLGAYYPIKDLDWGVIIKEPKVNAVRALYKVSEETEKALIQTENLFRMLFLNVLLWICGVIVIAFLLAIRFSNYITAPLTKLIDLSMDIAKGDFSKRLQDKIR